MVADASNVLVKVVFAEMFALFVEVAGPEGIKCVHIFKR